MATWFGRRAVPPVVELPARSAYAAWAPAYPPRPHTPLMEVEQRAMLELWPDVAGVVALDAACGTGRYLHLLAERGARQVIGVDASSEMIGRATAASARLVAGDLRALPLAAASVEVAICGLALNDLAELDLAAAELARVLRPGGRLVTSVLHPRGKTLGWTRTFATPQGQFAVVSHWHSMADHQRAWSRAALRIDAVREPALADRGGPLALVVAATKGGQ